MMAEAASDAQFSVVALLAALVLLAGVIAWWQRSRGTWAGAEAIRLVSVRALGGKRMVALVEVERERFLLGLTDERISCLARLGGTGVTAADGAPADAREEPWLEQSA
jgi:flagellar biogenesis protein FliO